MSRLEISPDILIDPVLLDFSRTCRLCLQQSTELSPLFPESEPTDAEVSSLPTKIMACVSIKVLPEHNTMPKQVCSKCVQQIDNWVKFKELCESANTLLLQCLDNLQAKNDDANNEVTETLQNNFQGPDTILSDMDVSIFERDSLFGALEEGSLPLTFKSDDLNVSFSESMLNQKIQSSSTAVFGNTSTPKRLNESNDNEICNNILSNTIESLNLSNEKSKVPEGPSKWKLKYDEFYKKTYPCGICNKEFSKFMHLLNHDRSEHSECLNDFSCSVCGMLFVSKSRIDIHMLKHGEKTFECVECQKMFLTKKSLSVHMRLHNPDNKFRCNICNVVRTSQRLLDDHIRCMHTKEMPFRCELCGKEFTTQQSKNVHYNRHFNKTLFKCHVCDRLLNNANSYRSHMDKHKLVKDIVCFKCGKSFKTRDSLSQHMRTHADKVFKCLICSSSFTQRYLLVRHEATHLDLHPYSCNVCNKSLKRKDLLTEHMLRHTNNIIYPCNNCSKEFNSSRNFKRHKCAKSNNVSINLNVTTRESTDINEDEINCSNNKTIENNINTQNCS